VELERNQHTLEGRIAELEGQKQEVESELAAARAANLALGNVVKELQQEVDAGKVKIKAVEGGAKVDAETIRDLRSKLSELQAKEAQVEREDSARLADLQRVNKMLKQFVHDKQFQMDLDRPLVKVRCARSSFFSPSLIFHRVLCCHCYYLPCGVGGLGLLERGKRPAHPGSVVGSCAVRRGTFPYSIHPPCAPLSRPGSLVSMLPTGGGENVPAPQATGTDMRRK